MDFTLLCNSPPKDVAKYLRDVASHSSNRDISQALLDGIDSGALPLRVFTTWLTASNDPKVVNEGLRQQISKRTRQAAIIQFRRWFRTRKTGLMWDEVGGTAGILDFLAEASVHDVKHFCHQVGTSARSTHSRQQRQQHVDELFQALNFEYFPNIALKNSDQRPLSRHYLWLVGACSPDLAFNFWRDHFQELDYEICVLVIGALPVFYRLQCLHILYQHEQTRHVQDNLRALLQVALDDPRPRKRERLSPHMAYSLDVLRRIAEEEKFLALDHLIIHSAVILPAFQRFRRRRTGSDTTVEAVRLFLDYSWALVNKGNDTANIPGQHQILRTVVHRWGRYPDALQDSLERLLNLAPFSHQPGHDTVTVLLQLVPLRFRYILLRTLFEKTSFRANIEVDNDLKDLHFCWLPDHFLALPKRRGRGLLERLIRLNPGYKYGNWYSSHSELPKQHEGDPTCLRLLLSRGDEDSRQMAETTIVDLKDKTSKARQQPARAALIKRTLDCAVAAGFLDIYRDTMLWTRRYIKDPLTSQEIYGKPSLHTKEGIGLLSGFPAIWRDEAFTTDQVREAVRVGNQICADMVETARLALNEPSFQPWHWRSAIDLLDVVVEERLVRVRRLQRKLGLDDSSIFELIWQPTIDIALELESIGLKEANKELCMNKPTGILSSVYDVTSSPLPSTFYFLDELASRRNAMWEEHRRKEHPAVMTLPDLFPKGLSVQHFNRCKFDDAVEHYDPTYLRDRAEKAVFIDPEQALLPLSMFEDSKDAIDTFIEHWETALEIYIYTQPKAQRYDAALKAWKHATGPLSRPRLSTAEAYSFWSNIFHDDRISVLCKSKNVPWREPPPGLYPEPKLPAVEEGNQPIKWNPDPDEAHAIIKKRTLDVTCLDAMLTHYSFNLADAPNQGREINPPYRLNFWQRHLKKIVEPTEQEALIAAATLYLSEKHKCPGILSKPYPSEQSVRFPGLYLDEEFVERADLKANHRYVLDILKWLSYQTPLKLLLDLIRRLLGAKADRDALILVRLLVKGDRPQLALGLVQELILERPGNSSWHRTLLSLGFLRSLPQATVKEFMTSFSGALQGKLIEQSQRKPASENPTQPLAVKVTTVKMLAQLLSDATFIDEASTTRVLIGLFENSRHLDIRVAVVESLLKILTATRNAQLQEEVLGTLETHSVPIMASLNERRPLSEDEWQEFEKKTFAEMPEVYTEGDSRHVQPILSAVCDIASDEDTQESIREALAVRILYPTLQDSIENNRRWLQGFFKHLGVPPINLPPCPVKLYFLSKLVGNHGYCTKEVLDLWSDAFAANYEPSQELEDLNRRIEEDDKLRDANASYHWNSLWNKKVTYMLRFNAARPANVLHREPNAKSNFPSATGEEIQEIVLKQADLLLRRTEPQFRDWNAFISELQTTSSVMDPSKAWARYCRPVLETIVTRVEIIRSSIEWRNNPQGKPAVLPGTFTQRLCLAVHGPVNEIRDGKYPPAPIVFSLGALIHELGTSQRLYIDRYAEMIKYLKDARFKHEHLVAIALSLGSEVKSERAELQTEYYMRVDLASQMLQWATTPPQSAVRVAAVEMARKWSVSMDEDVRMVGLKLRDTQARVDNGRKPWYADEA